MKAMKCEMCDGAEFIKQDGVYICQYCGMKYSVEEAKKMMVEGTVDIQGTVKVDNSAFVEKYLANARRAKQKEDWEETEKYYNMVEQNDPTNIEAIFYSAYGKAKSSLIENDIYKRQAAFKVLQNCISIIDNNFNVEDEEKQKEIIKQISNDLIAMSGSSYVYTKTTTTTTQFGATTQSHSDDSHKTEKLFQQLNIEFCTTLEEIIKKYPENDKRIIDYYALLISHTRFFSANKDYVQQCHEKWHKLDSSHEIPIPELNVAAPKKSGGCYVATAVYGSYDCPQVWTLRRYRDYTLAKTWYGRAFVRTYYAISPTLVKWFGHKKWFKSIWRVKLDKLVVRLNESGVENTQYHDMEW